MSLGSWLMKVWSVVESSAWSLAAIVSIICRKQTSSWTPPGPQAPAVEHDWQRLTRVYMRLLQASTGVASALQQGSCVCSSSPRIKPIPPMPRCCQRTLHLQNWKGAAQAERHIFDRGLKCRYCVALLAMLVQVVRAVLSRSGRTVLQSQWYALLLRTGPGFCR